MSHRTTLLCPAGEHPVPVDDAGRAAHCYRCDPSPVPVEPAELADEKGPADRLREWLRDQRSDYEGEPWAAAMDVLLGYLEAALNESRAEGSEESAEVRRVWGRTCDRVQVYVQRTGIGEDPGGNIFDALIADHARLLEAQARLTEALEAVREGDEDARKDGLGMPDFLRNKIDRALAKEPGGA